MELNLSVLYLHPTALEGVDFIFHCAGASVAFSVWNEAKLGPEPPISALEAAWPNAKAASVMAAIRAERNRRLAATDYMAMPDYPAAPAGLAAYRQALRDFPATINASSLAWPPDVSTLSWPVL